MRTKVGADGTWGSAAHVTWATLLDLIMGGQARPCKREHLLPSAALIISHLLYVRRVLQAVWRRVAHPRSDSAPPTHGHADQRQNRDAEFTCLSSASTYIVTSYAALLWFELERLSASPMPS